MLKRTYLRLVEMQEEQARQHLEEVRSIHNEMRGYKHDFHHHLQALKGQLEAGQVDRPSPTSSSWTGACDGRHPAQDRQCDRRCHSFGQARAGRAAGSP